MTFKLFFCAFDHVSLLICFLINNIFMVIMTVIIRVGIFLQTIVNLRAMLTYSVHLLGSGVYALLTKREVRIASRSKKMQKRMRPMSCNLDRATLVNKRFIIWPKELIL